jgi:hypothetical protein
LAELERLQPGSPFVTELTRAERELRQAEQRWAERQGLKSAGPHLPLRYDKELRIFGEPPVWRGVVGFFGMLAVGTSFAALAPSSGGALGVVSLAALALAATFPAWPRKKRVRVTQTSLVFDQQEIPIADILETVSREWTLELRLRGGRVVRLTMGGNLTELVDCLAAAATELEAARPPNRRS